MRYRRLSPTYVPSSRKTLTVERPQAGQHVADGNGHNYRSLLYFSLALKGNLNKRCHTLAFELLKVQVLGLDRLDVQVINPESVSFILSFMYRGNTDAVGAGVNFVMVYQPHLRSAFNSAMPEDLA
jgi:hypothetical protein